MKKHISLITLLLAFSCCITMTTAAGTPSTSVSDISNIYSVVDSPEWIDMNRNERVRACQLSEKFIHNASTSTLLQAVLRNPFMIDIYAFDTYTDGFNHVYNEFPYLKELSMRSDLGENLIACYQSLPILTQASLQDTDSSVIDLSILEIMIAQPQITDKLNREDIRTLVALAEDKYNQKEECISVYGGSYSTFYEAIDEVPNSVIALATSTTVRTPKGSAVQVINNSNIRDWTAQEIQELNSRYSSAYPTATRMRNPTKKYNCHSYAWYSTATSNYYWMNDPTPYMSDGSYRKTASSASGYKVYWKDGPFPVGGFPIHSGILASNMMGRPQVSCNSKWGQLGLYNHPITDSPYSGAISYWCR